MFKKKYWIFFYLVEFVYLIYIFVGKTHPEYKLPQCYCLDYIIIFTNIFNYSHLIYTFESTKKSWILIVLKFFLKIIRKLFYFRGASIYLVLTHSEYINEISSFFATVTVAAIAIEILKVSTQNLFTFTRVIIVCIIILLMSERTIANKLLGTSGVYFLISWIVSKDFIRFSKIVLTEAGSANLNQKIQKYRAIIVSGGTMIVISSILVDSIRDTIPYDIKRGLLSLAMSGGRLVDTVENVDVGSEASYIGLLVTIAVIICAFGLWCSVLGYVRKIAPKEYRKNFLIIIKRKLNEIKNNIFN